RVEQSALRSDEGIEEAGCLQGRFEPGAFGGAQGGIEIDAAPQRRAAIGPLLGASGHSRRSVVALGCDQFPTGGKFPVLALAPAPGSAVTHAWTAAAKPAAAWVTASSACSAAASASR